MKRILTVLLVLVACTFVNVYAEEEMTEDTKSIEPSALKEVAELVGACPTKGLVKGCLECHKTPSFKIKYNYPNSNIRIHESATGKKLGYYTLRDIYGNGVKDAFKFIEEHGIKYMIIEVQSPGGSMMEALKIISLIDFYRNKGFIIETRCHGFAASAGFMIFAAGNSGHRLVSPTALLMWHEVQLLSRLEISNPSKTADKAFILRFFQDNANVWLSTRCNLSKEEIDKKVYKSEWWLTGREALKYGIADSFL